MVFLVVYISMRACWLDWLFQLLGQRRSNRLKRQILRASRVWQFEIQDLQQAWPIFLVGDFFFVPTHPVLFITLKFVLKLRHILPQPPHLNRGARRSFWSFSPRCFSARKMVTLLANREGHRLPISAIFSCSVCLCVCVRWFSKNQIQLELMLPLPIRFTTCRRWKCVTWSQMSLLDLSVNTWGMSFVGRKKQRGAGQEEAKL